MNIFLVFLLILSPLITPETPDQPLPRGFQTLELEASFDTGSSQVSTFSDSTGKLSYVWISPKDRVPVNVGLVESKIARLAWHHIIRDPSNLNQVITKSKNKYHRHFIKQVKLDQGFALLFKDKQTHMVIRIEGTVATWELISISSGLKVELQPNP